MIKGVSRRVVVVQPDARDIFEQAIFLVRDQTLSSGDIIREACRVADRYLLTGTDRRQRHRRFLRNTVVFLAGAAMASAVWLFCLLVCK